MRAHRTGDSVALYLSDEEHRWLVSAANLEAQLEQNSPHAEMAAWYEQIVRRAHECRGCRVLCVSRSFVRWLAYVNRFAKKMERSRRDIAEGRVQWEKS